MNTNKLFAIVIALLSGGYLLPFSVSLWRDQADMVKVFFINLLLGWTIIGWVYALFVALK